MYELHKIPIRGTNGTMGQVKVSGGGALGKVNRILPQKSATAANPQTNSHLQPFESPTEAKTQLIVNKKVNQ